MSEQKDQETMHQLLPTWRRVCLNTHDVLCRGTKFMCTPFVWIAKKQQEQGLYIRTHEALCQGVNFVCAPFTHVAEQQHVYMKAHEVLRKSAEFVCTPFTWFVEQVNGTADFKATEARIDAAAAKAKTKIA